MTQVNFKQNILNQNESNSEGNLQYDTIFLKAKSKLDNKLEVCTHIVCILKI